MMRLGVSGAYFSRVNGFGVIGGSIESSKTKFNAPQGLVVMDCECVISFGGAIEKIVLHSVLNPPGQSEFASGISSWARLSVFIIISNAGYVACADKEE